MRAMRATPQELVSLLLKLFGARIDEEDMEAWAPDAIFEDPICYAKGRQEIATQWYGLRAIMHESRTLRCKVVTATEQGIDLDLQQEYNLHYIGVPMIINSKVQAKVHDGRIVHLVDRWFSVPQWVISLLPLFALRRLNGLSMPHLITTPRMKTA